MRAPTNEILSRMGKRIFDFFTNEQVYFPNLTVEFSIRTCGEKNFPPRSVQRAITLKEFARLQGVELRVSNLEYESVTCTFVTLACLKVRKGSTLGLRGTQSNVVLLVNRDTPSMSTKTYVQGKRPMIETKKIKKRLA